MISNKYSEKFFDIHIKSLRFCGFVFFLLSLVVFFLCFFEFFNDIAITIAYCLFFITQYIFVHSIYGFFQTIVDYIYSDLVKEFFFSLFSIALVSWFFFFFFSMQHLFFNLVLVVNCL